MAPPGSAIKTYSKRNTSSNALNSLLMTNLVKRKQSQRGKIRKGLQIKALPLPDEHHHLLDDSFEPHLKTDDPFDLVCRLSDNSVVPNVEKVPGKSSDSLSVSKRLSSSCDYLEKETKRTRRSKMDSNKNLSDTSKLMDSTDASGLHIKKVNYRPQISYYSSLSSLSTSTVDISYNQIFNKAPNDNSVNKLLVASTPPTIISSTPIRAADLVVETYQEICSWNLCPNITPKDFEITPSRKLTKSRLNSTNTTPSKCSLKNNLNATVQLLCSNDPKSDYKLKAKPKVILCDMMDVIGISNTVSCPHKCKGFSKEDQNFSHQRVQMLNKIKNGFTSSIRYHGRNQKRNSLRIKTLKRIVAKSYSNVSRLSSESSIDEGQVRKRIDNVLPESDLQGTSLVLDNQLEAKRDHNNTTNVEGYSYMFQDHNYSLPENALKVNSDLDNADQSSINKDSDFEKSCSDSPKFNEELEHSSSEEEDYQTEHSEVRKILLDDSLNGEDFSYNVEGRKIEEAVQSKKINDESWIESSDSEHESFEPSLYHKERREVENELIDCAQSSVYEDHSYVEKIYIDKSNCPVLQYSSHEDMGEDIIETTYDEEGFVSQNFQTVDNEDDAQVVNASNDLSCLETSIALCSKNIKKYKENMNLGVYTKSNDVISFETSLILCEENISKLKQNMNESIFTQQTIESDAESDSDSSTSETPTVLSARNVDKSELQTSVFDSVLSIKDVDKSEEIVNDIVQVLESDLDLSRDSDLGSDSTTFGASAVLIDTNVDKSEQLLNESIVTLQSSICSSTKDLDKSEEIINESIQVSDSDLDISSVSTTIEGPAVLSSNNIDESEETENEISAIDCSSNLTTLENHAVLSTDNVNMFKEIIHESIFATSKKADSCSTHSNLNFSLASRHGNISESDESNKETISDEQNLTSDTTTCDCELNDNNVSESLFSDSDEDEIVVTDEIDPNKIQKTLDEDNIMISSVIYISSGSEYEGSSDESSDEPNVFDTTDSQPSCFDTPSSNNEGSRDSENISRINSVHEDVIEVLSSDEEEPTALSSTDKTIEASIEESIDEISDLVSSILKAPTNLQNNSLVLKSGKSWRRTLSNHRRSLLVDSCPSTPNNSTICACAKCQSKDCHSSHMSIYNRRLSVRVIPESPIYKIRGKNNLTVLESYASNKTIDHLDCTSKVAQSLDYREDIGESLINVKANNALIHDSLHYRSPPPVTAREIVLRRCGQIEPKSFSECYTDSTLQNCFKIGEGVYGEVFLFRNASKSGSVMKVIPIEGNQMVNGERQKKFEEILSEIIIAGELSNLRGDANNHTSSFSEVQNIRCVRGCYPKRLLELWEMYDDARGSENDSPDMFKDEQLYIILELANGGKDMEAFVFTNAVQALSLFKQTACALAIAEASLQFEHRDLHWGNLLITQTEKDKTLTYRLNGTDFLIPACGIEVSIIDFTLSRITFDGVCIFNDLSLDPDLFTASGDYQFEVYKLMKKQNGNEWQHFEPYTNVLWLHYILDKIIHLLHYKYSKTRIHHNTLKELQAMKDRILSFDSAVNFVNDEFLS